MKKEIQQIKIAEATGWKLADVQFSGSVWYRHAEKKEVCERQDLPDYLNDLNAMHEAEKTLSGSNQIHYLTHLYEFDSYCPWSSICATAAQRAEAFLRTLNLWEEEQ